MGVFSGVPKNSIIKKNEFSTHITCCQKFSDILNEKWSWGTQNKKNERHVVDGC
jgi:hypothetical protein